MALSIDEKALVIPAHAWTPWFSVFGAFSGFDSIEECFDDMSDNVFAIETGLSSDPAMNWQIKELDGRTIISSSDAHSLEKIGREATVFEAEEVSYDSIYDAITGWPLRGNGNEAGIVNGETVTSTNNVTETGIVTDKPSTPTGTIIVFVEPGWYIGSALVGN